MLSGYTTRHLMAACGDDPARYYVARCLRILPPYLLAMALGTVCWSLLDVSSPFLSRPPGLVDWFANLVVVPLNLYAWTGQDRFTVVPQAWSLALELQFYAVAPLLVLAPRRLVAVMVGLSLAVWVLACVQVVDPDLWGYRMLAGTFFLFFTGFAIAGRARGWCALIYGLMGLAAAMLASGIVAVVAFNAETVIGFFLGGTLVPLLARLRPAGLDTTAGTLSYPLFLSHTRRFGCSRVQASRCRRSLPSPRSWRHCWRSRWP